jgi:hypothetical protein
MRIEEVAMLCGFCNLYFLMFKKHPELTPELSGKIIGPQRFKKNGQGGSRCRRKIKKIVISARYRVRAAGSTMQQQSLMGQGTQGGTQIPSDPILARLVSAWPSLSEKRKKIIGSLMGLS